MGSPQENNSGKRRTFVIGDIHGGLRALIQVLERAALKPGDQLIFLGDYVDGWSDSVNVISYLITFAKQNSCIFLRGNHDDLVHDWLKTGELNEKWLQHGGQASMDGYRKISEEEKQKHLQFYDQMLDYYIDNENRLFVHAGFTNLKGPEHEYNNIPFYWDRTLWELALALNPNLKPADPEFPVRLHIFKEIFIGHTPVSRIGHVKPQHRTSIWNMDTGAAYKGKLSLMDVVTKKVVQSDPVWKLYPNETGRN